MADNSTILEKLDGLVARFEETSTLITDPAVIADQKRYVKLTKEYKELDDLMKARKEYIQLLGNIEEAKNILANEPPCTTTVSPSSPESRSLITLYSALRTTE